MHSTNLAHTRFADFPYILSLKERPRPNRLPIGEDGLAEAFLFLTAPTIQSVSCTILLTTACREL